MVDILCACVCVCWWGAKRYWVSIALGMVQAGPGLNVYTSVTLFSGFCGLAWPFEFLYFCFLENRAKNRKKSRLQKSCILLWSDDYFAQSCCPFRLCIEAVKVLMLMLMLPLWLWLFCFIFCLNEFPVFCLHFKRNPKTQVIFVGKRPTMNTQLHTNLLLLQQRFFFYSLGNCGKKSSPKTKTCKI